MTEDQESGQDAAGRLAAELKRLREMSKAGAASFKALEDRIGELEKQIAKTREARRTGEPPKA